MFPPVLHNHISFICRGRCVTAVTSWRSFRDPYFTRQLRRERCIHIAVSFLFLCIEVQSVTISYLRIIKNILKFVLRLASCVPGKEKPIPVRAYYRPRGFQKAKTPRFRDSRHMKVVVRPTHWPPLPPPTSPPGNITCIHFC